MSNLIKTKFFIPLFFVVLIILLFVVVNQSEKEQFKTLSLVMGVFVAVLIGSFGILILIRILDNTIDLTYLISESNKHASLSRFQFLIFTFVISMSLFFIIVSTDPPAFPIIPSGVFALLGISGGSYVISKGIQHGKDQSAAQSEDNQQPVG